MDKNISVAEAKATFSECIRKVEAGSAVLITRHGKPVAAQMKQSDDEVRFTLAKETVVPEGSVLEVALRAVS